MFEGESIWIRDRLAELALPDGAQTLEVGSSTPEYRSSAQPHIERNVYAPMQARGVSIVSLDLREGPGIDYSADITSPEFDPMRVFGRRFEVVLCNNVLVHLADVERGARAVADCVAPGGHLLVSTPASYRRVRDPLDNGFRPTPLELARLLGGGPGRGELTLEDHDVVRIDDRRYYRHSLAEGSWFSLGERWVPVPAVVEQIRYLVKPLRWRVSCVLMRRSPLE